MTPFLLLVELGDRVPGADRMTPFLLLVELGWAAVSKLAKDKLMRQPHPPRKAGNKKEFRGMLNLFVQAGSQARLEKDLLGPECRARERGPAERCSCVVSDGDMWKD